jgi:cytoskeletal protein RodZ
MSTETLGEKLRQIREQNGMPLRRVAVMLDIDVAILSKIQMQSRRTFGAFP